MRLQFRSCCVVKKICWVCNSRLLNLVFKNPCVVKARSLSPGHKHLKELNCCDEHESLWLHLRPTRLLHHCCSNLPSTKVGRQIISGAPVSIPYSGRIKVSQLWYPSNRRFQSFGYQLPVEALLPPTNHERAYLEGHYPWSYTDKYAWSLLPPTTFRAT